MSGDVGEMGGGWVLRWIGCFILYSQHLVGVSMVSIGRHPNWGTLLRQLQPFPATEAGSNLQHPEAGNTIKSAPASTEAATHEVTSRIRLGDTIPPTLFRYTCDREMGGGELDKWERHIDDSAAMPAVPAVSLAAADVSATNSVAPTAADGLSSTKACVGSGDVNNSGHDEAAAAAEENGLSLGRRTEDWCRRFQAHRNVVIWVRRWCTFQEHPERVYICVGVITFLFVCLASTNRSALNVFFLTALFGVVGLHFLTQWTDNGQTINTCVRLHL